MINSIDIQTECTRDISNSADSLFPSWQALTFSHFDVDEMITLGSGPLKIIDFTARIKVLKTSKNKLIVKKIFV